MSFEGILGQKVAVTTLRRALQSGRVHHAYRFEGPDGVGKEKTAMALAQALVCEQPREGEGCGACPSCRRAITFSKEPPHVPMHPDVLILERGLYPAATLGKDTDEKQNISIDQVRKVLQSRLAFPPYEGRGRLVILRNAEELHLSAANALLKTLEEPPSRTHFVLLTSRGRQLLDTIRSRTLLLRFAPLGPEVMSAILTRHKIPAEAQAHLIDLSAGSVTAALTMADAEETEARRVFVDGIMAALAAPNAAEAMALAQARDKEKDALRDKLALLAVTLAREARARVLRGEHEGPRAEWVPMVFNAMRELDRNVSPALVLETMLLRMRAAR